MVSVSFVLSVRNVLKAVPSFRGCRRFHEYSGLGDRYQWRPLVFDASLTRGRSVRFNESIYFVLQVINMEKKGRHPREGYFSFQRHGAGEQPR